MLVTYPDARAHKHACGTVVATPSYIHSTLHLLERIEPVRKGCTAPKMV